jgi:hypothetical protein
MNEVKGAGRKRLAVIAATVLTAASALLSVASPVALAAPTGIFAPFAQCPTSNPRVTICQYVEITGGELAVGAVKVPIDETIIFQGGMIPTGSSNPNEYFQVPAANGESISPTELNVPGGLRAVIGCDPIRDRDLYKKLGRRDGCNGRFSHDTRQNKVTVTLESAGNRSNPAIFNLAAAFVEEGTAFTFPGKVHLKNPLLGEACYIGSEAHPIELHLTTAKTSPPPPNQPIAGRFGTALEEEEEGYAMVKVTENTLVDNAFTVPPAEGCGGRLAYLVDPRIDHTLGLESPAGRNTAILTGTHRLAVVEAVLASEKFPAKENPTPPPPHHHHAWWPTH